MKFKQFINEQQTKLKKIDISKYGIYYKNELIGKVIFNRDHRGVECAIKGVEGNKEGEGDRKCGGSYFADLKKDVQDTDFILSVLDNLKKEQGK